MICKIADLIVDVPDAGGMASRCREYRHNENAIADITIKTELYRWKRWQGADEEFVSYMDSGYQFHVGLLNFDGLRLHASAVEYGGKAYLFSGPCGMGKSTHTRLWQSTFGEEVKIFNDDKPALRRIDGVWYAYGTPWCGKDHININMKAPLAGICFLKQGEENCIRRLSAKEAIAEIMRQTIHRLDAEKMSLLLSHIDKLIREIPIFELTNRPEEAAARLSYETMSRAAKEAGL